MSLGELRNFVRERASWILDRLSEPQHGAPLRLVNGDTLLYLGRGLRLTVRLGEVHLPHVSFGGGRLLVTVPRGVSVEGRRGMMLSAIAEWYRGRAEERVRASVQQWLPEFGLSQPPPVLIGNQRSFWGSCSADGTLRFSWRTVMLDHRLIDYIAVHELAHLKVMNHSKAFWAVVTRAMPDALQRRRRLREASRGIPL